MMFTEHDYDCVARHLDGEAVNLTDAQQALLDELQADESASMFASAGQVPDQAAIRARHRLRQAAANRPRRGRLAAIGGYAAAAAAAAIVLIIAVIAQLRTAPLPAEAQAPIVSSDVEPEFIVDPDIELLAAEINEINAEIEMTLAIFDESTLAEEEQLADALLQNDIEAMLEYFN
jgi:hypothetical protein